MFEGLFGQEDDDASWEVSPPTVSRGGKAPVQARGEGSVPFIGISNQGATCYLNSLIHALYFTPEFRHGIYAIGEDEMRVEVKQADATKDASSGLAPTSDSTSPTHFGQEQPLGSNTEDEYAEEDQVHVGLLQSMGFEEFRIKRALKKFSSAIRDRGERAMEWLLDGGGYEEEEASQKREGEGENGEGEEEDGGTSWMMMGMMGDDEGDVGEEEKQKEEKQKKKEETTTTTTPPSSATTTSPQFKVRLVPKALQSLFATLQIGDLSHASTEDLTASFNWKASHTREQHDVHELSRVLMDVIERSLKGTSQQNLVKSLFHGSQCHQIICKKCKTIKERSESFGDLTLAIPRGSHTSSSDASNSNPSSTGKKAKKKGRGAGEGAFGGPGTSLEMCMAHYFGTEILEGRNQYECDVCATKTDAEIGMRIKKLPKVLCLSLARMEYDYSTGNRIKNTSKVSFPPSIDVASFMAEDSHSDPHASHHQTTDSTQQVHSNPESESTIYDLYAVIIHKGASASSGHYHVYIKDLLGIAPLHPQEDSKGEEETSQSPSTSLTTDTTRSSPADPTTTSTGASESAAEKAAEEEGGATDPSDQSSSKSGGKRQKRAKASASTTPSSTTTSTKSKSETSEEVVAWVKEDKRADQERLLSSPSSSNELTSQWFDFDDMRVTRIDSSKVPSTFSSNECAYMFFYKQRTLLPSPSLSPSPSPSQLDLDPPPYVIEQMVLLNQSLAAEREAYEQKINEIEIQVVLPHHLVTYQHTLLSSTSTEDSTLASTSAGTKEAVDPLHPSPHLTEGINSDQSKSQSTDIKPSDLAGPPLLKWVEEEKKKGLLIDPSSVSTSGPSSTLLSSWPSSSTLASPVTVIIDQRKPFKDLVALVRPIFEEYRATYLSLLPPMPPISTKAPKSIDEPCSIHFDLVRSYHDRVMIERSFLLEPQTFLPLQHATAPSSDASLNIPSANSINDTLIKNLDMAKKQSLLIWDGSHFNVHVASRLHHSPPTSVEHCSTKPLDSASTPSSSIEGDAKAPRLLLPMLTSKLPDASDYGNILTTPWTTIELRVYGQWKEQEKAPIEEGKEEALLSLFNPHHPGVWDDICVGSVTLISFAKSKTPYDSVEGQETKNIFVATLHLKLPASTPMNRLDSILKRSKMITSLLYPEGASMEAHTELKIAQPCWKANSDPLSPTTTLLPPAAECTESLRGLTLVLDAIKSLWKDREGLVRDADIPIDSPALGPQPPTLLHISSPIIVSYESPEIRTTGSSVTERSPMQSIIHTESQDHLRHLLARGSGEEEHNSDNANQGASGSGNRHDSSSSSSSSKQSKTVNLYVILGLKLPRSSFHIGPSSSSAPSSAGLLRLNEPLPESSSSSSSSSSAEAGEAGSFHPRYLVKDVRENMTLRELVERILSEEVTALPKPPQLPPHHRLFSVDAFDQRDRLYDNMNMTVKSAMLTAYQTVWLEEGSEPKTGLLQLTVHLFRLNPNKKMVGATRKKQEKMVALRVGEDNATVASEERPETSTSAQTSADPSTAASIATPPSQRGLSSTSSPLSVFPTTRPNLLMIPLNLLNTLDGSSSSPSETEPLSSSTPAETIADPVKVDHQQQQKEEKSGEEEQEKSIAKENQEKESLSPSTAPPGPPGPPPPPPPPPPPKSTCIRLETTLTSTLASLKDSLAEEILQLLPPELSRTSSSSSSSSLSPFDFFLSSSIEERRRSMSLWIEDQVMVGDEKELKSWRLNSHSRFSLALILLQTHPSIIWHKQKEEEEEGVREQEQEKDEVASPLLPPLLLQEEPSSSTSSPSTSHFPSLFSFRAAPTPASQASPAAAAAPLFSISSPPNSSSILIFFRRRLSSPPSSSSSIQPSSHPHNDYFYGPLTSAWISPDFSSSSSDGTKKQKGKGGKNAKITSSAPLTVSSLENGQNDATSTSSATAAKTSSPSPAHVMVDLESLVNAFSRLDLGENVPVPPEWLLLAKIGIHPHNHDMQVPKWQLLWKPAAYLDQVDEEGAPDLAELRQQEKKEEVNTTSEHSSIETTSSANCATATESTTTTKSSDVERGAAAALNPVETMNMSLEELASLALVAQLEKEEAEKSDNLKAVDQQHEQKHEQHHHHILLKHLSDPKTPSSVSTEAQTTASSSSLPPSSSDTLPSSSSPSPSPSPSYSYSGSSVNRRKVKVVHGDVFVLDDARSWSLSTHDDVFWDNQRRIGAGGAGGQSEDQYMSDLERALLESTKSSYRRNTTEVGLTIHIDDDF